MKKNNNWKNEVKKRNRRIYRKAKRGLNYAEIGREEGLTRQAVKYIVDNLA